MKKLLAVLLALTMVAMMAISASATIFTYDDSDDEWWDDDVNMLDRETYILVTRDGTVAQNFGRPDDTLLANKLENLNPGWYEAIWVDTADVDLTDISHVKGKVGIALRGNITFNQKCMNVLDNGGIACLICNNYRDEDVTDAATNEIAGSRANTGMSQTDNTVPNVFLTSDIGTKLICESTGKSYEEMINAIIETRDNDEINATGIPAAQSTYVFLGLLSDYEAIGEFSEDKVVAPENALKDGAPNAEQANAGPKAEALDIPADAAHLANNGSSYDSAKAAATALGTKPLTNYVFQIGSNGNGGEGPENLWDDDVTTKFYTASFPTISVASLSQAYAIDGIIMATANDNSSYNGRSPNEWAIFGSADNENWEVIAVGDDSFFEETDFTYYAAKIDPTKPYQYFQFQGTGSESGTFQVSELVLCSSDAASYPASGESGNAMIGKVIGNETGWDGTAASGAASAFDGIAATFFDPLGVGDGYCGMEFDEPYILEKVAILSRSGWLDRFEGATIEGSNDGENWEELWCSDSAAPSETEYNIVTEFENNYGYKMFRYVNYTKHGDVAEVEFYGKPGTAEAPAPAAEEPKTEEPAPAAEEPTPAAEEPTPAAEEPAPAAETPTETPAADNKPAETAKSGCGSMIGGGFIVLVTLLGSAWIAKRK